MKLAPFFTRLTVLSTAVVALSATAEPSAPPLEVPHSSAAKSSAAPRLPAVSLTGVRTTFAQGEHIGVIQSGPNCQSNTTREWSDLIRRRVESDLPEVFREEVSKTHIASIAAAGMPSGTNVQAVVSALDVRLCDLGKGVWRGSFNTQVSWQVVTAGTGRVVYRTSTRGAFTRGSNEVPANSATGLRQAFAASVRNLLADQRFVAALRAPDDQSGAIASTRRY
jgi:hypothetical protein